MWKIIIIGCGVCVAYFAGRISIWKVKEQVLKTAAGSDTSPMSILAKGVLCVQKNIGPWSAQDVVLGLAAMAKVTEKEPLQIPGREVDLSSDAEFLMKAQHWRALAEAIYVSDSSSFSLFSHLPESFIVAAKYNPDQSNLRPAYALVLDPSFGALVLSIRGTSHAIDMLVSAGTSPVPFMGGHAHSGFVRATEALLEEIKHLIDEIFKDADKHNVKKLVIVGHSMGAAVATMCGLKLREDYRNLECWAYSVPASLSAELAKECSSFATCFVGLHDVVPRFSLASVEELRKRVCNFDWKRAEQIASGDDDWEKISNAVQMMENFQRSQNNVGESLGNIQREVCSAMTPNEQKNEDQQRDHQQQDQQQEQQQDQQQEQQQDQQQEDQRQKSCGSDDEAREKIDPPGLYPPGRLLVLASDPPGCGIPPGQRSGVSEQRNYGSFPNFEQAKDVKWLMREATLENFSQIILSPWCISDHVLGNLCEGIAFFQKQCTRPLDALL